MKAEIFNFQGWIQETSPEKLTLLMEKLLETAEFTVLNKVKHVFHPRGFTAVWILAESHLAVHSFPEENKTYLELSSCNKSKNSSFVQNVSTYILKDYPGT